MGSSNFPIDAVYLWVDGNDPDWDRKKENTLRTIKAADRVDLHKSASSDDRFRDNDELKYSLRSLEKCMPWIRNVFLITDNQYPDWINREEVVIIDHKDVFPDTEHLPTFNSHSIELCQHRIDDLSECFISFNDDFILNKNVKRQDFFTRQGDPVIWAVKMGKKHKADLLSKKYHQMTPHKAGETRARRIIFDEFGLYLPFKIRHYPRPMKRSIMTAIWEKFPDEVNKTLTAPFRCTDDVAIHTFFSFYAIASGLGKLRVINGARQIADALIGRLRYMGATIGDKNFEKKLRRIKMLKPMTICLNDGDGATNSDHEVADDFLYELYPHASKYENPVSFQDTVAESI